MEINNMSDLFLKEEEFERIFKEHLKIETYSRSIESLFSLRMINRINFAPYYQRNYVWDNHKASYFIESILLGTEIPPLIFFNNGNEIEVIDGRQRFETIKRFKSNEFALSKKGLFSLKQLGNKTLEGLIEFSSTLVDTFLDAKLRIIQFEIVNEPKLNNDLEDKIKKEIFARYNSGITPLKKAELDNALYDKEPISIYMKDKFKKEVSSASLVYRTFFNISEKRLNDPPIEKLMEFIRRILVLKLLPIKFYASTSNRTEIMIKMYDYISDTTDDEMELCKDLYEKILLTRKFSDIFEKNYTHNRLVCECFIWVIFAIEKEGVNLTKINSDFMVEFALYIQEYIDLFAAVDSHYYKNVMARYRYTAEYFENKFDIDLGVYLDGSSKEKERIKKLRKHDDAIVKLNELETLRVLKPDPARESIEDVATKMNRRKFLVRPSYQRSEVINITKASSIIESILLGVKLPPIFLFKREDGVSEVVDGQQRILTILGYIGQTYVDVDNKQQRTKNHEYSLRKPKILKNLHGKKFKELDQSLQDKIIDFELFMVEIEERLNPQSN
jgi:hypothetical protein